VERENHLGLAESVVEAHLTFQPPCVRVPNQY